jgi:hypothetical protein
MSVKYEIFAFLITPSFIKQAACKIPSGSRFCLVLQIFSKKKINVLNLSFRDSNPTIFSVPDVNLFNEKLRFSEKCLQNNRTWGFDTLDDIVKED